MIAELRDAVLAADRVAGAPSRGEVRQRAIDATAGLERFLAAGDVGAFDRSLDDAQASVGAYVGEAQRAEADHRRRVVEISAGVEQISDEVSALAVECEQLGFRPASLDALLAVSRQLRDALAQGSLDEVARLREEARARFGEVNAALDAWINDRAGADVVITELASVLREVGLRVDPQVLEVMAPGEHGTRVVVARQRDDTALRFAVSSDGTGGHAVTCDGDALPDEAGRAPEEIGVCADLDATLARVAERLADGDVQLGPWRFGDKEGPGARQAIASRAARVTTRVRQTIHRSQP